MDHQGARSRGFLLQFGAFIEIVPISHRSRFFTFRFFVSRLLVYTSLLFLKFPYSLNLAVIEEKNSRFIDTDLTSSERNLIILFAYRV